MYYVGYLIKNKLEFGMEAGYSGYKVKCAETEGNEIGLYNLTGMFKGTYYFDELRALAIRPYLSLGVGIARVFNGEGFVSTIDYKKHIYFENLNAMKQAYQFEGGIAMQDQNVLLAFGVKLFGVNAITPSDLGSSSGLTLDGNNIDDAKNNFNFGSINQLFVNTSANIKLMY
jgi:hypothetical protein